MKKFLLLFLVAFIFVFESRSQNIQIGYINGVVNDDSTLKPIKGTHVYLLNNLGWQLNKSETDINGKFFVKMPVGVYYIYFKSERYLPEYYDNANTFQQAKPIEVKVSDTVQIKASLKNNFPNFTLTPPKNLKATQNSSYYGNLVLLSWSSGVTTIPGHHLLFNIYRSDNVSASPVGFKKIATIGGENFYDKNIVRKATYKYYLTAYSAGVESKPSDTVAITIQDSLFAGKGIIKGIVFDDSTKQPIERAFVGVVPINNFICNGVEVASNGTFELPLYAGSYYLYFKARDYNYEFYENAKDLSTATKFEIKNNDTIKISVGLSKYKNIPQTNLSGVVVDSAGKGVKSEVSVYRVKLNSKHYHSAYTKTDESGKFTVKVNLGDTVVVYARPLDKNLLPEYFENKSSFNEATRIAITENYSLKIVVNKRPIYANGLSGSVKDSVGVPKGASIAAIMLGDKQFGRKIYSTLTDSTGVYGFTNMEPAKYILFAKPTGDFKPTYYRADGKTTIDWRKADTLAVTSTSILANVNFVLHTQFDTGFAIISGYVKDKNNKAVSGVTVYALDENKDPYTYAITNSQGFYIMNSLNAGTYSISTDVVGYEPTTIPNVNVNFSSTSEMSKSSGSIIINPIMLKVSDKPISVSTFVLEQNYPNPFNPSTTIKYSVPTASNVKIVVYDLIGREVAQLVNTKQSAGEYSVKFSGSNLPSGIYIYQLQSDKTTLTRKLTLLK